MDASVNITTEIKYNIKYNTIIV